MTKIMNTYARMCDSVVDKYHDDLKKIGIDIFSKEDGVISINVVDDTIIFKEIRQAVPYIEGILACYEHMTTACHPLETVDGYQMSLDFGGQDE